MKAVLSVLFLSSVCLSSVAAEKNYDFRNRLGILHPLRRAGDAAPVRGALAFSEARIASAKRLYAILDDEEASVRETIPFVEADSRMSVETVRQTEPWVENRIVYNAICRRIGTDSGTKP